jgi:hypothetical protein
MPPTDTSSDRRSAYRFGSHQGRALVPLTPEHVTANAQLHLTGAERYQLVLGLLPPDQAAWLRAFPLDTVSKRAVEVELLDEKGDRIELSEPLGPVEAARFAGRFVAQHGCDAGIGRIGSAGSIRFTPCAPLSRVVAEANLRFRVTDEALLRRRVRELCDFAQVDMADHEGGTLDELAAFVATHRDEYERCKQMTPEAFPGLGRLRWEEFGIERVS